MRAEAPPSAERAPRTVVPVTSTPSAGTARGTSRLGLSRAGLSKAALDVAKALILAATVASFALLWMLNPQTGRFLFALPPLALLAVLGRTGARLMPWAVYALGFLLFVDLRMVSAELFFPARYDYVIEAERLVFGGTIPAAWLQGALYRLGAPDLLDAVVIAVHLSFFVAPHLLAVLLWMRDERLFRRYVYALLGACYAALIIAFLLPTAPPWLAGEAQRGPLVYRVLHDVAMGTVPDTFTFGYRAVGENAVAAMPSLHTALACLVALALARTGRWPARAGVLYVLMMAFALVYLGEHYVVDVLAGAALAGCVWWMTGRDARAGARPAPARATAVAAANDCAQAS